MSYAVFDTSSVEGRRKLVARELGARAIRLNHFDSEPGREGHEHDERESGQEEIYIPLRGRGVLRVDGAEVTLDPGRYVLVPPEATRQVVAGARCSFPGDDAGSNLIRRYGRDRGRCQGASSVFRRHRLYFATPSRVGGTGAPG